MKKRTITFLLVVWTIINLIAGTLLFVDIQILKAPEITATINVAEINEEEAIILASINVSNPNSFGLSTKNFEVVITAPSGDVIARVLVEGGSIPPNKIKTFTTTAYVGFKNESIKLLSSRITGNIGINIGFIQKTIPIAINVITSVEEITKKLAAPSIKMKVEFGELTQKGLNLTGTIEAYNPNSFDIIIGDISGTITSDTGKNVGNLKIEGGTLESEKSLELKSTGTILLAVLNYKAIIISISGSAGARVAGINETVPISIEAEIKVPDISNLLAPHVPTDVLIIGDYKFSLKGLIDDIVLEIDNPNKIDIEAKNIIFTVFFLNAGEKTFICETTLEEGIVKAQSKADFKGQLIIPYSKLFSMTGGRLLPDQMLITVRANVTIPGINQTIWVGVTGYQDFRFFN
jgi:LEA14-like dessication related protein